MFLPQALPPPQTNLVHKQSAQRWISLFKQHPVTFAKKVIEKKTAKKKPLLFSCNWKLFFG
jgi:hypothetical protein